MATIVNLYDAKTKLSELVERAAGGEEIVIAKAGKLKARLVGLASDKQKRKFGVLKGKLRIADDFDGYIPTEFDPYLPTASEQSESAAAVAVRESRKRPT